MQKQPTLEIRLPISPNPRYMRMVRYFLSSLIEYGGEIGKQAHVVLSVSRDAPYLDLTHHHPFLNDYSVSIRWVDEALFQDLEYDATGVDRFWVESDADIVAMMDVDMLIAGDFDDAIRRSWSEQKMLGFIAHVSPFTGEVPSQQRWTELFEQEGLAVPEMSCEHTGWGHMSKNVMHRYCPPYFNYGMIVAPRPAFERLAATALDDIRGAERYYSTWFRSQIAITVGIYRHDIPWGLLSINDNYPMHQPAEIMRDLNPDPNGLDSPEDIRIFHYLGKGEVNKSHFADEATLSSVLARSDLSPTARVFAKRLSRLRAKPVADT